MKKGTVCFLLCIVVFISLSFMLPSDSFKQKVLNKVKSFYTSFPTEKVYLHTDKPYYVLGENIWFKAYLVDGMHHQFVAPSQNLYVDLVSPEGKVIDAISLRNSMEGIAGDFALDNNLATGTYILRAYTRSMQNFPDHFIFQKEIQVYGKQELVAKELDVKQDTTLQGKPNFDLHFFPEGGDLIHGLSSKVGVKAVGENGNGLDIAGKVFDEKGEFVTNFKTLKFGLGVFNLTPSAEKRYTATVTHNGSTQEFVLPEVKSEGYTIQYFPGRNQNFYLQLRSNQAGGLKGALLYGHARGRSFLAESVSSTENKATYEIATDSISEGVAHLTLFSPEGLPVCERLIFISKARQPTQLVADTDHSSYGKRSKVKLNLRLGSEEKFLVKKGANLSVSITDQALVQHQTYGLDIRSYLLLNSELKGRIEHPSYYFDPSNRDAAFLLDLLMMTQGWRRFEWDQLLAEEQPIVQYLPEQSFSISGQITKIGNPDKPIRAKVFFYTLDDSFLTGEMITEDDGKFAFTGLNFVDTTTIILRANRYREAKNTQKKDKGSSAGSSGNRYVDIKLDTPPIPQINSAWAIPWLNQPTKAIGQYVQTQQDIAKIDSTYRHRMIKLDTVSIEARKNYKPDPPRQLGQLYARPDHRLVIDSLGPAAYSFNTIFDLISFRFPGVNVQGIYPNQQVQIRGITTLSGSNAAMFVLDGVMISNDAVNSIPVSDIAYVDILKSNATAAIYGGRAATGVIALYTKKGTDKTSSPSSEPRVGMIDFKHPGYYKARTFYQPNYDKKLPEHTKPDIRTTLYWNPQVQTDKAGNVELEFYTDDKRSTYQVDVQGLSQDGTPLTAKTVFVVK